MKDKNRKMDPKFDFDYNYFNQFEEPKKQRDLKDFSLDTDNYEKATLRVKVVEYDIKD